MRRNYFVEGLQGAGKTTFVKQISAYLQDYQVFQEGDYSPIELAWCAYVTEKQYDRILEDILNYNVPIGKVLIDPEKLSFESEKVLFAPDNLLIQNAIDGMDSTKATKEKARLLFAQMEFNGIFGRNEIMSITGVSVTAAGNLITKLKKTGLIESVSGYGKGKYRFKKANA